MQDGILTVQDNLELLQKALLIHDGLCNSSFLTYWFVQKEKKASYKTRPAPPFQKVLGLNELTAHKQTAHRVSKKKNRNIEQERDKHKGKGKCKKRKRGRSEEKERKEEEEKK